MVPEHGDTVTRMPAELPEVGHFYVGEVIGVKNPKEEREREDRR